jgi:tetratricopeptide (TPR) repeat protein
MNMKMMPSVPEVTVVLQIREDPSEVAATIRALGAQEGAPSFEVLVILNTSSDNVRVATRQVCDPHAVVVRIVEEANGQAWKVRNRAVDECLTRWIVFPWNDTVPQPTWMSALSQAAKAGDALPASDSVYDMAMFDAGLRFEPWSDDASSSALAKKIRRASHTLDDETATLRHDWAETALKLGRLDEAWAIFDSLGDHPEYGAQASLYAGDFCLRDRLWLAARRHFEKCLELRRDWKTAEERLTAVLIQWADATANVHKKAALQQEALHRLQSVARPSELQNYQRASLEAAIGSRQIARALFTKLTAGSTFQVGAWFHLGEIALAAHDWTRAVGAFQRCVALQPAHRKAISRLTSLLLDARMCGVMNRHQQGGAA